MAEIKENSAREEYVVFNQTRNFVQSNILSICSQVYQNANQYVDDGQVSALRGFVKSMYYKFLQVQIYLNHVCNQLLSGKKMKEKKIPIG